MTSVIAWLAVFVTAPIALYLIFSGAPDAAVAVAVVACVVAILGALAVDGSPGWWVFLLGLGLIALSVPLTELRGVISATAGGIAVWIGFAKMMRSPDRGRR